MSEQISLGSCPKCGGPAQFIKGGEVRHVELYQQKVWDCEPYLKERETPAQCIARNRADLVSTLGLLKKALERAETAEVKLNRLRELADDFDKSHIKGLAKQAYLTAAEYIRQILNSGEPE